MGFGRFPLFAKRCSVDSLLRIVWSMSYYRGCKAYRMGVRGFVAHQICITDAKTPQLDGLRASVRTLGARRPQFAEDDLFLGITISPNKTTAGAAHAP